MAERKVCAVIGCDKLVVARGWCNSHYGRWRHHGDAAHPLTRQSPPPRGAPLQWLKAHVSYEGAECLIWPYWRNAKAYGMVKLDGRRRPASQVMCELAHGVAPTGKPWALHNCGQGQMGCVNPNHIYWGSPKDNGQDKILHGRSLRGSKHHKAKLNEEQVQEIRKKFAAGGVTKAQIAREFGVTPETVGLIVRRKSWWWLSNEADLAEAGNASD